MNVSSPEYVPSTALGTLHGLSSFILPTVAKSFLFYFQGSEAEEGKVTCPKCMAGKQRSWDLNPGSRTSEFTLLTMVSTPKNLSDPSTLLYTHVNVIMSFSHIDPLSGFPLTLYPLAVTPFSPFP